MVKSTSNQRLYSMGNRYYLYGIQASIDICESVEPGSDVAGSMPLIAALAAGPIRAVDRTCQPDSVSAFRESLLRSGLPGTLSGHGAQAERKSATRRKRRSLPHLVGDCQ